MMRLRDLPVSRKLTLISMAVMGFVTVLAATAAVVLKERRDRLDMVTDLRTVAQIAGDASAAALAFSDPASARETLAALAADPHIVGVVLYDPRGAVFATWQRDPAAAAGGFRAPPHGPAGHRFGDDALDVFLPIVVSGETAGTVYIRSDLEVLRTARLRTLWIAALVMGVALVFTYALSTRLQRLVTDPITALADVVASVTRKRDYAVRAPKQSDDELGQLIAGFNEMLDQIQARDRELREARDHLERRVAERTAELRKFRDAVEQSGDGVIVIEPATGRILDSNSVLETIGGYTHEEFLARGIRQLSPQFAEAAQWQALIDQARAVGPLTLETGFLRKDGSILPVEISGRYVARPEGDYAVAVVRDISTRKLAEAKLAAAQSEVLGLTRQAGMAEIATSVLHNVGNALNSVNVSAGQIRLAVGKSTASRFGRVVELLRAHASDLGTFVTADPQGRHVLPHLEQLVVAGKADEAAIGAEMDALTHNIDHIKEVVAMQQKYARVGAVEETVSVATLVEDCLSMNAESLASHGVAVVRELADLPPLKIEKHRLLQILMNLLVNARLACMESGRPDARVTVRTVAAGSAIRIEVADNGVGIPAENLTRIFAHGFTTRKAGHGFGLHGCALAAKSMRGSLTAHSDGPGRGATFTLELPT